MAKVNILFEVNDKQTFVSAIGSDGKTVSRREITDTEIEQDFTKLLKKIEKTPHEQGSLIPL